MEEVKEFTSEKISRYMEKKQSMIKNVIHVRRLPCINVTVRSIIEEINTSMVVDNTLARNVHTLIRIKSTIKLK